MSIFWAFSRPWITVWFSHIKMLRKVVAKGSSRGKNSKKKSFFFAIGELFLSPKPSKMVFQMLFFFSNAFFTSTWPFSNKPFSHVFPTSSTALQARVQVQNVDDSRCYTGDIQSTHHAGSMEALSYDPWHRQVLGARRVRSRASELRRKTPTNNGLSDALMGTPKKSPQKPKKKLILPLLDPFAPRRRMLRKNHRK